MFFTQSPEREAEKSALTLRVTVNMPQKKQPDEYVPLDWRNCVWVSYICLVSGIINGMSIRDLFRTGTTHFTGSTTRFSIATASSILDERDIRTRGWYVATIPTTPLQY